MTARLAKPLTVLALAFTFAFCAAPPPAQAVNVVKPICTLAGLVSGIVGKACTVASHASGALKAGKKLLGGHLGGALQALTGGGAAAKALTAGAVVAALVAWVTGGAKVVLNQTASVISTTTRPQLQSTWFSSTYWRMAAISALLTLPFLFAAAVQAVMHSDMAMLAKSTLGYLPLGVLAVSIAAPVTTLLLAASDELSAIVSGASGNAGATFLSHVGFVSGGLSHLSGSTFVLLFAALLTVTATITLWIELLIRSAAVYVVVLMLPLFFAALVWPARRVWAVRAVEVLVALIISKFAIVAVLSLGAAALGHTTIPSVTQMLEGATLVMLAAFSPWALLRLLPLHELTGGLDGLRSRPQLLASTDARAQDATETAQTLVRELPAEVMSRASGTPDGPRPADIASRAGDLDGPRDRSGGAAHEAASDADAPTDTDATTHSEAPAAAASSDAPAVAAGANGSAASRPDESSSARSERVSDSEPGARQSTMEPMWRADSWSWQTMELGTEVQSGQIAGPPDSSPAELGDAASAQRPLLDPTGEDAARSPDPPPSEDDPRLPEPPPDHR